MYDFSDNDDWYEVTDMNKVVDFIRKLVYDSFSDPVDYTDIDTIDGLLDIRLTDEEMDELNQLLSLEECLSLFKPKLKVERRNGKNVYFISSYIFEDVVRDINGRMISNTMRSLVEKDLIEVAFDNDKNDFVFWLKKKGKNDGDISTYNF